MKLSKVTAYCIIFTFTIAATTTFAQFTWQKTYASPSNYEYPAGLVEVGATYNIAGQWGTGSNDIFFLTTDNQGNITVIRKYNLLSSDFVYGFRPSTPGFTVFGNSFITGERTPYILSLNSNGTQDWCRRYYRSTGATNEYGCEGKQTADGGYILLLNTSACRSVIIKTTATGAISWQREFAMPAPCNGAWHIDPTADGGYIFTGYNGSVGAGGGDLYLIKLDNASPPAITWAKAYGRTSNEGAGWYPTVRQTADGGYIAVTTTNGFGSPTIVVPGAFDASCACPPTYTSASCATTCFVSGCTCVNTTKVLNDIYVIKTDASGNINNNATSWAKTYRLYGSENGFDVIQTSDGGYAIAGSRVLENNTDDNMLVIKIASDATVQWSKQYGRSPQSESAREIIQTSDGGYLVGGTGSGTYNLYLVKTDGNGNVNTTTPCSEITNTLSGVATATNLEVTDANTNAITYPTTVTNIPLGSLTYGAPTIAFTSAALSFTYTASIATNATVTTLCPPTALTLPIDLTSFGATCLTNGKAEIKWSTEDNKPFSVYKLERSTDGNNFEEIGKVNANPEYGKANYSLIVQNPPNSDSYYHLKLIESDNVTVSDLLHFVCENKIQKNNLTLSKSNEELQISFFSNDQIEAEIQLINSSGQSIYKNVIKLEKGNNAYTISTSGIQQGVYLILLQTEFSTEISKISLF